MKILLMLLISSAAFAQTYNCKVTVQSDVTTSTTSATGVPLYANASRRCLILENKDAAIKVYVKFGSAHSGTEGLVLQPNARWEAITPPGQSIFLKAASGTPVVGVISGQ